MCSFKTTIVSFFRQRGTGNKEYTYFVIFSSSWAVLCAVAFEQDHCLNQISNCVSQFSVNKGVYVSDRHLHGCEWNPNFESSYFQNPSYGSCYVHIRFWSAVPNRAVVNTDIHSTILKFSDTLLLPKIHHITNVTNSTEAKLLYPSKPNACRNSFDVVSTKYHYLP